MNRVVTALMGTSGDESKLRLRLRLITAMSFCIALLFAGTLAALIMHVTIEHEQREAEVIAANQSSMLEERLARSLSATYALAAMLRNGRGEIDQFDQIASEMLKLYGGISSLQLAKDGIVSKVVPLGPNAKAIGHDLLKDPARNKEAFLALQTRSLTLAGPMELLQGGLAVVGRLPVFLPDGDGQDKFWGFVTALIRIPDLLISSGLPQLEHSGYRYELAYIPHGSEERVVFVRSGATPQHSPVVRRIDVPNGRWFLSIEPVEGWIDPEAPIYSAAAAVLLALLLAGFTHTVFKQPLVLARKVEQRTRELADANRALSIEIEERQRAQRDANQINRMYSVLSHTNGAIVRIGERDQLLEEICRIAVEYGGFPLARIALLDARGKRWRWVAQWGKDVSQPECDELIHAGLTSKVNTAHCATLSICSSRRREDMDSRPICSKARKAGFESHVVLQLRVAERVGGVFSLYAREPDSFDAAQLRLLEEMAEDLSFALSNIEGEAQRRKVEDNLRKLSRAVEQSASAVMITDRHGVIEYVNPWFTKINGYSADEIIGKTPHLLSSQETHPETYKRMWDTLKSGKEWTGELHNTKKNGELYWCLETISPLKNEDGEITHYVAVTEDISERKQNEQTIRNLAFHDPLTGLPNRRLFNDRLQQAIVARQRKDTPFALMLLDLDRFKTVNDTLGHDVGDALLKAVAARLTSGVRQGDTLARMGGDEFALLSVDIAQPEDTAHIAGKLVDALKAPFQLYGHELYVTGSVGVTLFPSDAADGDALIRNADIALYRAKDIGRNNFQFFTEDMNSAIMQRLQLENSMRSAIERNEFMLYFQPQVDIVSGRISGTEALIRWCHPTLGTVSPAKFIPLAEETGMIVQIGEWVLRTACAQAKAWQRAGTPMRVAVNLSARQFLHGDLAETIEGILEELQLPPALLEVELTEGILMEDTSQTGAILARLHRMGVQISIDDFGTGYSSLSYLKRLPIQVLKIDQSFVRDIHTDPDDRAIVTAVIALAHSMRLEVVAEGVETREQLSFLREYGCDVMQGYLFSKPVTGDDVLALLAADSRLSA
ncbi:EAL domain-containing protein [Noviherbaspirillum sp. UKPF54]|uniref:EAL domain-containing protein n=1 Tax=Noviherbaspirillum sp. UKPF54 TaxID=2601898 RepID=UPI0011B1AA3B|nr:EAL domain-containing protein [Noviherbaspirillum sp. UKPF54]QDZ27703.1 EAL domain-containing protein [Noviherbaspirillum sp. UKPF54]